MKPLWLIFLIFITSALYAQSRDDSQAARQYFLWVQQALDEGRLQDAVAGITRSADFENVSSDISYLKAVIDNRIGSNRRVTVQYLNKAIDLNRWETYSENDALLLKAEMLVAMREYHYVLTCLDLLDGRASVNPQMRADSAMLRLRALRGLAAAGDFHALARFRSQVLLAMDRFSRDPRPLRIFFEYAHSRMPDPSMLAESDMNLMDLALRRLPFLLEADPELTWKAAPFIYTLDDARRIVASYRAGGISHIQNRDFKPHPASIPLALNFGLIDDFQATEELFSGSRGFNNPLPAAIVNNGNPVLDKDIIVDVYNLLKTEEGRDFFTRKLLTFTGIIFSDDDYDGYIDSYVDYDSGVIKGFEIDRNQSNVVDFFITFTDSALEYAFVRNTNNVVAQVYWERYPHVIRATWGNPLSDNVITFNFRPAEFNYTPIEFIQLGGSNNLAGLIYPEVTGVLEITYRSLVSFCSTLTRPSVEFERASETFYMERGIPIQAVETLDGRQVSVTRFERGLPVIQHIDLDLDGRMETIRRFRQPPADWHFTGYRQLIESSESDWSGDGRHITREVYQEDGSVVYSWDIDGSGEQNYQETRNR